MEREERIKALKENGFIEVQPRYWKHIATDSRHYDIYDITNLSDFEFKRFVRRGHRLVIAGELTDLNTYIDAERKSKYDAAEIKKTETYLCQIEATRQLKGVVQTPVHLHFMHYSRDRRKDPDNLAFCKKFILDGMVNAGVLPGDSRKYVKSFKDDFGVDKQNPRIEVTIMEVEW